MEDDFLLFSGTANQALGASVANELGIRLGACQIERFPDGELSIRIDQSVRRREVFFVQPTAPPVNDTLMELLAFVDACRRAAATRVTAIIPYFGYARSDRRHRRREPITASLTARLIESAGVDHVVTLDLHAAQIEGFFRIPVDELCAVPVICRALPADLAGDGTVVVSPDTGRVKMASDYAARLGSSVAVLHKRRMSGTETEVTHVVGDVQNCTCLIIDDMIATGGTITSGIEALLAAGATADITVAATHGLFVGDAAGRLSHPAIREVLVTDSVAVAQPWPKLRVVSVASLIAGAIRQTMADGSFRDLETYAAIPSAASSAVF